MPPIAESLAGAPRTGHVGPCPRPTSISSVRRPRLKPTIEVIHAADGALHLYRGGGNDFAIRDHPDWMAQLLSLLDGSRPRVTLGTELDRAGFQVPPAEIDSALAQLHQLGLVDDAARDSELPTPELERYDRQLRYFGDLAPPAAHAVDYQLKLRDARIALLGLGGLGGCAALTLAAAGVGHIEACDGDRVELSNLNRQVLYTSADVGHSKAVAAQRRIRSLNPEIHFNGTERWIEGPRDVERAIDGADIVVDAVDRPAHKIERWVDAVCFRADTPYIGMSQSPPFVRVGPTFVPGLTGCYQCQEAEWRQRYELFDELADKRQAVSPVAATGPAAAVVGALVGMEVIHFLTGLVQPATLGAAVVLDMRSLTTRRVIVKQDAQCTRCRTDGPSD
jgi:molybdopterin-synthase adenylyltransferase